MTRQDDVIHISPDDLRDLCRLLARQTTPASLRLLRAVMIARDTGQVTIRRDEEIRTRADS